MKLQNNPLLDYCYYNTVIFLIDSVREDHIVEGKESKLHYPLNDGGKILRDGFGRILSGGERSTSLSISLVFFQLF